MATKTNFGLSNISKPSPTWLVPAFSAAILVIGAISFMISGDTGINAELKGRIINYLSGLTMLISGLAPLFGVKINTNK